MSTGKFIGQYGRSIRPAERMAIALIACLQSYFKEQGIAPAWELIPDQPFVEEWISSFVEFERSDARLDEHNNKGRAEAARDRAVELANVRIEMRKICLNKVSPVVLERG